MPAVPSVRILVVEDHPLVAEAIGRTVSQIPAEVEIVHSPAEARDRMHSRLDLVILDLSFRDFGLTRFDLLRECRGLFPLLPVIIVSMYDDEILQKVAREEGASGFVSKMTPVAAFAESVRQVLAGGLAFNAESAGTLRPLTPRELEIAGGLLEGLSESNIANKMGLSVRMVETHIREAKRRVQARSIGQLLALAIEKGLLLLPRRPRPRK